MKQQKRRRKVKSSNQFKGHQYDLRNETRASYGLWLRKEEEEKQGREKPWTGRRQQMLRERQREATWMEAWKHCRDGHHGVGGYA